ncbi:MAG: hypothetical protein RR482_01850 [Clostridia bacterium]
MLKIGLYDVHLDEWHANHYPKMLREAIARRALNMEPTMAYAQCNKQGGLTTSDWCAQQQMTQAKSAAELADTCDVLILLGPSFPERHLPMLREVLREGKSVYMDKIFAPDAFIGAQMFEEAAAKHVPLFSSSALRFAEELTPWRTGTEEKTQWCMTTGPNVFSVYAIHQMEMLQCVMGGCPVRVKAFGNAGGCMLVYEWADDRTAVMNEMNCAPFAVTVSNGADCTHLPIQSAFFDRLIDAMLTFFQTGNAPVAPEDTLAVMRMLSAGTQALQQRDIWLHL